MSAPTSYNRQNSRTPSKNSRLKSSLKDFKNSKYDTAKINYTAVGWGNDHGSVTMGQIHKDSDVTAAVMPVSYTHLTLPTTPYV